MSENSSPTEEAGAVPVAEDRGALSKLSPRAYLNPARRLLREEELTSPRAIRLLISESDQLADRCSELEKTSHAFNELRVAHAALSEKHKKSTLTEILVTVAIGAGAVGLSQGQRLLSVDGVKDAAIAILVVSALVMITALLAKAWK